MQLVGDSNSQAETLLLEETGQLVVMNFRVTELWLQITAPSTYQLHSFWKVTFLTLGFSSILWEH